MSLLNIRSLADLRAFAYVLLPVISTLLVTLGIMSDSEADLWGGLVLAILGPVVAFIMARDLSTFRTAFYAVLAAGQAILIGYGLATADQIGVWLPVISAVVGVAGGGIAAANTDTTYSGD